MAPEQITAQGPAWGSCISTYVMVVGFGDLYECPSSSIPIAKWSLALLGKIWPLVILTGRQCWAGRVHNAQTPTCLQ